MSALQYFNVEANSKKTALSSIGIHEDLPSPISPTVQELDDMPIGSGSLYHGPLTVPPISHVRHLRQESDAKSWQSPWPEPPHEPIEHAAASDVEASRAPTPAPVEASDVVQTFWNPPMNKWRVLAISIAWMCNGANDSAPGALLPYMEEHYKIGYAIVSLIFISNAIGFIAAAPFVEILDRRLGRARVLMLCEVTCILSYVVMAVAPPFPIFVIA